MNETSLSLLHRLQSSPETDAWDRLVDLYSPLVRAWLFRYGVQQSDADDLVQEVLLSVSKDIGKFTHGGRAGAFRAWIRAILVNRLRNYWRARNRMPEAAGESELARKLAELEDPTSELSRLWNEEHDEAVLKRLLELVEPQFEPRTWEAFCRVAFEGEHPRDVAAELQISLNAVAIAKSRVLNRLRQEAEGLVETSSDFLLGD
ncbi:MAG: sigma-70 family RNA polymerase sigma factor [Planctomycetota bacterium]